MVKFKRSPFNRLPVLSYLLKVAALVVIATFFHSAAGLKETGDPVKIGLDRLKNQRSFQFEWQVQRFGVKGDFKGNFRHPDQIGMKGKWKFGEKEEKGEWFASGDEQFEWDRKNKDWKILPRGEETDPLRQMLRILSTSEFEFLRRGRFKGKKIPVYGFKPNAPFLDPSGEKSLHGEIWLEPKTLLPVRVEVTEGGKRSRNDIGWELVLTHFNKPIKIKIPTFRYQVVLKGVRRGVKKVIEERMEGTDFKKVAVSVEKDIMKLGFRTSRNPEKVMESLITQGRLQIHLAQFPKEPVSDLIGEAGVDPSGIYPLSGVYQERYGKKARLIFEGDDVARPLILQKLLLTEEDVREARVAFDELSRPVLQLRLTQQGKEKLSLGTRNHIDRPIGIVSDGKCLSSIILRSQISEKSFQVSGDFTLEEVEGIVLRLRAGPLTGGLRIASLKKVSS
jgi:hypothetical protein